ncbi:chemotaxis protein CheW [Pseudomonas sp. Hz4]
MNLTANIQIALVLIGLVVLGAGMLFVTVRFYVRKFRQSKDLPVGCKNSAIATPDINIFEVLQSVRSNLQNSKKLLHQMKLININDASARSVLPRALSFDKNANVSLPINLVGGCGAAEHAHLKKTGDTASPVDTEILEQRIEKIAREVCGLDEALQRLQIERQNISLTAPSVKMEHISCSPLLLRQYLPFFLGKELFAVSLSAVQEILQARKLVIELGASGRVRNAINLRGSVIPVIDLNKYFGGEVTNISRNTLVIILLLSYEGNQHRVGIKVEGVSKILKVDPEEIEQELDKTTDIRNRFTIGHFKTQHSSITLLDITQWFALKKIPNLDHRSASQE